MFSICFMLILIKEFETEQTVRSRWPYECEISKLFSLPQTPPVNSFKLIPASERLPALSEASRALLFSKYLPSSLCQELGSRDGQKPCPRQGCCPPTFTHSLRAGGWISRWENTAPWIWERVPELGCTLPPTRTQHEPNLILLLFQGSTICPSSPAVLQGHPRQPGAPAVTLTEQRERPLPR